MHAFVSQSSTYSEESPSFCDADRRRPSFGIAVCGNAHSVHFDTDNTVWYGYLPLCQHLDQLSAIFISCGPPRGFAAQPASRVNGSILDTERAEEYQPSEDASPLYELAAIRSPHDVLGFVKRFGLLHHGPTNGSPPRERFVEWERGDPDHEDHAPLRVCSARDEGRHQSPHGTPQ